ncbi:signal peptidase I [Acaryochloris marina]|uniref:Signal peptidase I n=1 Tax=Acaryochloris marina (strain MBIC 11017) TaxID=329726 RepID=B0CEN2_ACAM1|nr:signal peptidase I [Acaryochloris marina]ABW28137.1 signal peptidase I [Acaryochloris marina MBIC11017]
MLKKSFFFSTKVGWREATKTVGLSLLLAFGIRSFVAEARFIPSGSMEPTLQIHDRLIIDKVTYQFNSPQRGDIIVFRPPQALRQHVDRQDAPLSMDTIIKRVIGIPGDQLELKDGAVYRNQVKIREQYVAHKAKTSVQVCPPSLSKSFLGLPQVVPADHYLVLGDNRLNSYDGRCWGLVSRSDLLGRAVFRYWPVHRIGNLE